MPALRDLMGQTFGRITVVSLLPERSKNGKTQWRCRCSCGEWAPCVIGTDLTTGNTRSCGCLQKEVATRSLVKQTTHGLSGKSGNSHYTRWVGIKQRTTNPNAANYHNYGGRGIFMHHTWIEAGKGFERFKWYLDTVLGPCPEGMSLDRKDNDQGYEPGNLQWATQSQQLGNRRTSL